jgi:uncharacterized protein YidB (DUF937 family)
MGLLDQLLGGVTGQLSGGQLGTDQQGLVKLALELVNNYPGGLQALIAQFAGSGLGQQVQSWVSTGQSLPISADQIMQVLGGARLESLAQQVGITQEQAANGLADVLPEVINQLTPSGTLQADAIAAGVNFLKGKLLG